MNSSAERKAEALAILREALAQVQPQKRVSEALADWPQDVPCSLLAIGKAAWTMAEAVRETLGDGLREGLVITKHGHSRGPLPPLTIIEASHPVLDETSLTAGHAILEFARRLKPDSRVLILLSGGGSALAEVLPEGVTLKQVQHLNEQLLRSGAPIEELNRIRRRISRLKGGKLAALLRPHPIEVLILSDIVNGDPRDVASGPVFADPFAGQSLMPLIRKYQLKLDPALLPYLSSTEASDCGPVRWQLVGSGEELCEAARAASEHHGYPAHIVSAAVTDSVSSLAKRLIKACEETQKGLASNEKQALIFGGEPTVDVSGSGMGGRTQHLALLCAQKLQGQPGITILAAGSDGTDGPTDAAGGLADETTWNRLEGSGEAAITNFDAYPALAKAGSLIVTGPTGTNVNDLIIALIERE